MIKLENKTGRFCTPIEAIKDMEVQSMSIDFAFTYNKDLLNFLKESIQSLI